MDAGIDPVNWKRIYKKKDKVFGDVIAYVDIGFYKYELLVRFNKGGTVYTRNIFTIWKQWGK